MSNTLNLSELNQEQCLNLLRFNAKTGGNICLFGQRGTGKTTMALQIAKECNLDITYLNLSTLDRGDILGLPNIYDKSDIITYKSPYFLPKLQEGQKPTHLLLLDEIDKCAGEITAPLLEILQFRTINGKPLNIVACVATANLPEEQVYSSRISSALLDRTMKFILSFNFQIWLAWARSKGLHPLVLSFLCRDPQLTCGKISDYSYASPSPRGWEQVSRAIQQAEQYNLDDTDTITNLVAGYVGFEAATLFQAWFEHYRVFEKSIHSMLEGRENNIKFAELDKTAQWVFTSSACALAKNKCLAKPNKPKFRYLESLCEFLDREQVDVEIQLVALRNSFPMDDVVKYGLINCENFFEKIAEIDNRVI
jgi:hypothetical protein